MIESDDKKILVDPGSNKKLLLKALKEEKLELEDIDAIFITHWHPDHILNIRLFPDTEIFDVDEVFSNDEIRQHGGSVLGTDIQILETPGHDPNHASLLVETDKGKIAIAGDVFWWEDEHEQDTDLKSLLAHVDPFVKNRKQLMQSRKKLLSVADYIIPGHGTEYKVESQK